MDLSEKNICINGNEYKPPVAFKASDFSIDHILNKAGSSVQRRDEVYHRDDSEYFYKYTGQSNILEREYIQCSPILNWLQYTRYKPPRLPRPLKVGPVKRTPGRLPRVPFTPHQLKVLEDAYKQATYLSSEDANKLAIRLDLTCTRVKIWFQNRRARERREKREREITNSPQSSSSSEYNHLNYELEARK